MIASDIKMFIILFILSTMTSLAQTEDLFIGELETYQHRVSGKVWIVSETQLRLTEFNYDGQGPGTYVRRAAQKRFTVTSFNAQRYHGFGVSRSRSAR